MNFRNGSQGSKDIRRVEIRELIDGTRKRNHASSLKMGYFRSKGTIELKEPQPSKKFYRLPNRTARESHQVIENTAPAG